MERELIKNDFFLESTRTYLEKIFNIKYMLLMDENFDEYVLKSLFLQKIPTLRSILLNNKISNMDLLLIPLMKQKYEAANEKFKNLIITNQKLKDEDDPVLSSAKVRSIKFRVLSEIQLAIFDYKKLTDEKNQKHQKKTMNKISREFESLIFHIKLTNENENDPTNINEKILEEFFKKFLCCMPDNYLIEYLLTQIFNELEFDSEWISLFLTKCRENKEKINSLLESSPKESKEKVPKTIGKKRIFNQMMEETIDDKLRKEDALGNKQTYTIQNKKLKTIDNYFPKSDKELGFRNVKEKIEGNNNNNDKFNKKSEFKNNITPSNIYDKSSLFFSRPITPSSLITELNFSNFNFRRGFNIKEALDYNMNNVTLASEDLEADEPQCEMQNKEKEIFQQNQRDYSFYDMDSSNKGINQDLNNAMAMTSCLNRVTSSTSLNFDNVNNRDKKSTMDSNFVFNSNNKSTNYSNLSVINSGFKMNNFESTTILNDNSFFNNFQTRSNSNIILKRGINSRLAGNIQNLPKTKKIKRTHSVKKKNSTEKIIEKFFDRIHNKIKEEGIKNNDIKPLNGHLENKNSVTDCKESASSVNNPLKKIINKQFYRIEKSLKSPSPIQIDCPKYSKRAKNIATSNENLDINQNSNISTINPLEVSNLELLTNSNTNSNISTLEGRFDVLKSMRYNKSNSSSNMKKSPDTSTGLTFDSVGDNNNLIILNKIKNKANNLKNENNSDDEILVYATPRKPNENMKYGRKSPGSAMRSNVNLLNLFNQFKQKNK